MASDDLVLGHTKEYIKNKVLGGTHYRLSPTELLMQPSSSDISSQPKKRKTTPQFAALDLKVDDRLGDAVAPNCHFKLFEVKAGDEAKWLEEAVDKLFTLPNKTPRIPYQVGSHLYTHVAQCIAAISYKGRNLLGAVVDFDSFSDHGCVTSETELRYSVIDPILEMICNCWGYKVTRYVL